MMELSQFRTPAAPFDWGGIDLYRFFAFVFAPPSQDRFDVLSQATLQDALCQLWQRLGGAGDFPDFSWFRKYEEYEAAYIALFDVGVPEPPVPLFESAHDKTKPAQEIALENIWFYDVLGLKWDSASAVPDYLLTQLEFLAAADYILVNTQDSTTSQDLARLETDFLVRHMLNWVPAAGSRLNHIAPSSFGLPMVLLTAFLRNRRDELRMG